MTPGGREWRGLLEVRGFAGFAGFAGFSRFARFARFARFPSLSFRFVKPPAARYPVRACHSTN
jgi:hypothetical protein